MKDTFFRLAAIGGNRDGSVTRLLFSESYRQAAEEAKKYLEELGLSCSFDPCMNLHGVLPCGIPGAKTLYLGSHLDTVDHGGYYDGMLGFVCAAEAVRRLKESGKKRRCNLHILGTNGEEGNDLGGTFGSRALCGLVDTKQPGFMERAEKYGLTEEAFEKTRADYSDALGWMELHIEQGNRLEESGTDIGIVNGIVGLERYIITVYGESNHAGTTMMEYRKDALVGASRIIVKVDELARAYGNQFVGTIGTAEITPGAITVIPEKVRMILEIRNLSKERMARFVEEMKAFTKTVPHVRVEWETMVQKEPAVSDPAMMEAMEKAAAEKGFSFCRMPSGATHDGTSMSRRMPMAMLFVPSHKGLSHCKEEFTSWEAIEKGADVLADTLERLCCGEE